MRLFVALLFLICGALTAAFAMHSSKGIALILLPPYRIEMTVNLFIVLLICIVIALYFTLRLVHVLFSLPLIVQKYRDRQKIYQSLKLLSDSFMHFLEGRYSRSVNTGVSVYESGIAQIPIGLLVARSYHLMGDDLRRDIWLEKVSGLSNGDRAYRLSAAEFYFDSGEAARALEILLPLTHSGGRQIVVMRLLLKIYSFLGNWSEALKLIRLLEKHDALSLDQLRALKTSGYTTLLHQINDEEGIRQFLQVVLPLKDNDLMGFSIIEHAISIKAFKLAQELIEDIWSSGGWDPHLLSLYSQCSDFNISRQLNVLETYLHLYPRDSNLLLCLGRLCIKVSLWGKAKHSLEAALSLSDQPSLDLLLELSYLLDQIGEHEKASILLRKVTELWRRS